MADNIKEKGEENQMLLSKAQPEREVAKKLYDSKQDSIKKTPHFIVAHLRIPSMGDHRAPSPIFNSAPTMSTSSQRVLAVPSAAAFLA